MSSTTDRSAKGQALAVFALSLTAILLAGALAFDGGLVFVERRDQQNAADAAALAGARYLTSNTGTAKIAARGAARAIATDNGFTDGVDAARVDVYIPPVTGPHMGQNGYIEVQIGSIRPSIFASLAGILDWNVTARAVALNSDGAGAGFSILSLDDEGCDAFKVTGTGSAEARGDIQVNSTCPVGAMRSGGGGTITVIDLGVLGNCSVVGPPDESIQINGGGSIACNPNMGAQPIADPLLGLPQPWEPGDALPAVATPPQQVPVAGEPSMDIPSGCPGADKKPQTYADPQLCEFKSAYDGTTWWLYPGAYPGGLDIKGGTIYFRPGVYYIFGGGLNVGAGAQSPSTAFTVDVNGNLDGDDAAGGVLFFNSKHPTLANPGWDPVQFNAGTADFEVLPLAQQSSDLDSAYNGILIWNDRRFPNNEDGNSIVLNGGSSTMAARGTIYSARGEVSVNGGESDLIVDQSISWRYSLNGNGGSILALDDDKYTWKPNAAGLIE